MLVCFAACESEEAFRHVESNKWQLESVKVKGELKVLVDPIYDHPNYGKRGYFLLFKEDNRYSLRTFGNSAGGEYTMESNGKLSMSFGIYTLVGEPEVFLGLNNKIDKILNNSDQYVLLNSSLIIKGSEGKAVFIAADE